MAKRGNINLNARDIHGWTQVMKTCINGHIDVFALAKKLKMRHVWLFSSTFFTVLKPAYSCQNWIHKQYVLMMKRKSALVLWLHLLTFRNWKVFGEESGWHAIMSAVPVVFKCKRVKRIWIQPRGLTLKASFKPGIWGCCNFPSPPLNNYGLEGRTYFLWSRAEYFVLGTLP